MSKDITDLLLTHGSVQVAPSRAFQLNKKPHVAFFDETISKGPSAAGYKVVLSGYSQFIRQKESKTDEYRNLLTALKSLNSTPRTMLGQKLKGSVTTYSVKNDDYRVDYRINSGQVEVYNIQPVEKLQNTRDKLEKTSVYKVKKSNSGQWILGKKVEGWNVDTDHAAVNGQSNNLVKATWLMGSHLESEYGKDLTEYTLFHNPSVGGAGDTWESVRDKFGFTTDVTKKFATVLEKAQQKTTDTKWVAHSQGGVIFAEGVRYLLNGKSTWALNGLNLNGIRNPNKGHLLDKQKIAFHANANNNLRSSRLFKRAGVEVVSIKAHDYDFVTNIIGANTLNPRKLIGSIIYSNHVAGGSVSQSPHTTSQSMEDWEYNMLNGPGKGRGPIQKGFNSTVKAVESGVKLIKNFLP